MVNVWPEIVEGALHLYQTDISQSFAVAPVYSFDCIDAEAFVPLVDVPRRSIAPEMLSFVGAADAVVDVAMSAAIARLALTAPMMNLFATFAPLG